MKRAFVLIGIFIASISMTSCDFDISNKPKTIDPDDFEFKTYGSLYKIKLPDYMSETDDLNDEASMQYQNLFRETYMVIIDESKSEYLDYYKEIDAFDSTKTVIENYRDAQISFIKDGVYDIANENTKSFSINGLKAEQVAFTGSFDDVGIYYHLTYIEGQNNLYAIMLWTLEDKAIKYKNVFDYIIDSFEEMGRRKTK